MRKILQTGLLAALIAGGALYTSAALAGNITMVLVRSSLDSDPDPNSSGTWQYEGGVIENGAGTSNIGHYIVTRRVTTSGTSADNTAAMTVTLFFPAQTAGNVPQNITLEGAWSYTSGQFSGSISAVSSRYRLMNGADATGLAGTGGTTKLTIDYVGVYGVP